ncbi:Hypothetical_protein [Hexamita inflata]|uniref:Hypothetical_protein n=1 Tax=Hexamita inflata TaxID=28002 RepID=A0AA86NTB5_9EUKA|nr:Hypothetical protein HINF_LOCUS12065 [Hexamita inflata]
MASKPLFNSKKEHSMQQGLSSTSKSSLTYYSLYEANQTLCYTSQSQLFQKSDSVNTIAKRYCQTIMNQEAVYVFTYLRSLNVQRLQCSRVFVSAILSYIIVF